MFRQLTLEMFGFGVSKMLRTYGPSVQSVLVLRAFVLALTMFPIAPGTGDVRTCYSQSPEQPAEELNAIECHILDGYVTDSNGNNVADATVLLPVIGGVAQTKRKVARGTTNSDGYYRLEVPKQWIEGPIWRYGTTLWVYKPGLAIGTTGVSKLLTGKTVSSPNKVILPPDSRPTYRILDDGGNPSGDITVEPQHYRTAMGYELVPTEILKHIATKTSDSGEVTIRAVEEEKLFRLRVESINHGVQVFRVDGIRSGAELRLRESTPLKGRVVGADPSWVSGIRLHLSTRSSADSEGHAEVTTDAEGSFEITNIATGKLRIEESLSPKLTVRLRFPERMAVPSDQVLELELVPATKVRGRVVRKQDRTPVVGADVSVRYGQFRQGEQVITDEGGRFEAHVLPGKVYQQVIAIPIPGLSSVGASWENRFEVPATKEIFELPTIELVETYKLPGQLVDESGNPLSNYRVWGVQGNRRYGFATTDEQGEFEMKLPGGIEMQKFRYASRDREMGDTTVVTTEPFQLRAE